jgi:hypothetical protein
MGFEDLVRAKHEFEDALIRFLGYLSVMSTREVELAFGRLADRSLSAENGELLYSGFVAGEIIKTYLHLRRSGEVSESKLKRLMYRTKKKSLVAKMAHDQWQEAYSDYRLKRQKADSLRGSQLEKMKLELRAREQRYKALPIWRKLGTPYPELDRSALTPMPSEPYPLEIYEKSVADKVDLGDLLIYAVTNFKFPTIEDPKEYATDANVRVFAQRLLESS